MLKPFHAFSLVTLGIAAACASIPVTGDPAVTVTAVAETVPVGTTNEDAADDPAIWRNPADPAKSLIVGTDKKGGLYVYDLAGREVSFLPAPGLNNVAIAELPDGRVLTLASDRSDLATAHIHVARLDTATGSLTPMARIAVGPGEGYGICIGAVDADGSFAVFSAPKEGTIYRTALALEGERVTGRTDTLATVPSQPEGCVADPRTNTLYVGEEAAGIWAIDMETGAKELVARVDNRLLVADVEGLALAPEGSDGGWLVASSQGDNAYAVFRLPGMEPLGRFRIGAGAFGGTEETDGIELDARSFGPAFPGGAFVAQDGVNEDAAQNFKLVRWDAVLAALEGAAGAR
ncbi:phytase [Erythrobacter sp.]|uniref:phytase n=1 Tax=Erythrobacter sp. TaxID=1042 RepID=UPI001425EA20|nr:phytase [Erythrobacter sp.]QIQ87982.1 MAG: phytase [Erythrobacter sp.]